MMTDRNIAGRIAAGLLALALLGGCSGRGGEEASTAPAREEGQVLVVEDEEPAPVDTALPRDPNQVYTAEEVEELVPEMAELDLQPALSLDMVRTMRFLNEVQRRGLEHYEGTHYGEVDRAITYALSLGMRREGLEFPPSRTYSNRVEVPRGEMERLLLAAFAQPQSIRLLDWYSHYYEDGDVFDVVPRADGFVDSLLRFRLDWTDEGDTRTVVLEEVEGNPTMGLNYIYTYEKGADGRYRLAEAEVELQDPQGVTPPVEARRIPDQEAAAGIFGAWGNTVFSCAYWDNTLTLWALDAATLEVKARTVVPATTAEPVIRDGRLFLMNQTYVEVLDESLQQVFYSVLPPPILEAATRKVNVLEDGGYDSLFGGYDLSGDYATYAYSTHEGMFLYNRLTNEETMIYQGTIGSFPGSDRVFFTCHLPRFSADSKVVYGIKTTYEGTSDYFYYDLDTATAGSSRETEGFTDLVPRHAAMGTYFGNLKWEDFAYLGQNYYLRESWDDAGGQFWVVGALDGSAPEREVAVAVGRRRLTVLPDGRIVFAAGPSLAEQYFCTVA